MPRNRLIITLLVLAAGAIAGGWFVQRALRRNTAPSDAHGARLLAAVMERVRDSYVDSLSVDELWRRAAIGLVDELGDPNSTYLPPDRLKKLTEATSGLYSGVGIQADRRDGVVVVLAVRPNSPAEHGGVQAGDRLVEADGQSMKGWTMEEARNAMRGPPGTHLRLVVERGSARIPFDLQRGEIHVASVSRALVLDGGVGYVLLSTFSDSARQELTRTVDSLATAGARSLILDLRNNPGGLLNQGVAIADLFLDKGQEIVEVRTRGQQREAVFVDSASQRWPTLPVAVVVNQGTASAAEIVAGALQDHDRALVLGRTSYGKGSAQNVFELEGGGGLKLTTARWFTPSGRSISRSVHADSAPRVINDRAARPVFTTDGGRKVFGGGGISPDLFAGDSVPSVADRTFILAVGASAATFRDVLKSFTAAELRRGTVRDTLFTVTPAMRDAFYAQLSRQGVDVPRGVYDDAAALIDNRLGNEMARQAFGLPYAGRRIVRGDKVVQRAAALLRSASDPRQLLEKIPANEAAPK
ncbi:MAG: S41 family peptidase [Gemmatimonadota bacterium]|nr:S41 family peptidase [Gemmatimonadota bacterium]